jgi:hypothetical protein
MDYRHMNKNKCNTVYLLYMRSDTEEASNTRMRIVYHSEASVCIFFTRCQCFLLPVLCSEEDPAAVLYKCDLADDTEKFILKNKARGFRSYK